MEYDSQAPWTLEGFVPEQRESIGNLPWTSQVESISWAEHVDPGSTLTWHEGEHRRTVENHCGQDLLDWKKYPICWLFGKLMLKKDCRALPCFGDWQWRNQRYHPFFQCESCEVIESSGLNCFDWTWTFLLQGCFGINVASNRIDAKHLWQRWLIVVKLLPSTWLQKSLEERQCAGSIWKHGFDKGNLVESICWLHMFQRSSANSWTSAGTASCIRHNRTSSWECGTMMTYGTLKIRW